MANTGYISSSGINQVFTTGPYSGSIVTSSYSNNTTLSGPVVSFYKSFISGSDSVTGSSDYDPNAINLISPCGNLFQRYYYDPIKCPTGNCLSPIALTVTVNNCNVTDYNYNFTFNSGSTSATYSTIEYSTIPDFSSNTGYLIVTNSIGITNPINISGSLPILPLNTTPVYFRVFNDCVIDGTSSYSNTISASCQTTPPPSTLPFTVKLKNTMGGTLFYTYNSTEYSLFDANTINLSITDLNPLNFSFRTLKPENEVHVITISGSSLDFNGSVSTTLNDSTLSPYGTPVYQSVNEYISNLYFNTEGTPDASISVDRSLWNGTGILEIDFTNFTPLNEENPWYIDPFGGGGGGSGF